MRVNVRETPDLLPCRAFLGGVDVSDDCFEADDEAGYVLLYKKTPEGRKYRESGTDEAAWERIEGDVRIEFPKRTRASSGKEVVTYGEGPNA